MMPRRAGIRRWRAVVWTLGWALSLSLLASVVFHALTNESMFDEVVEDDVKPGDDPADVEYALECAYGESERSRASDGVQLAVCRREATPGTYRIGVLNRSGHTYYIPAHIRDTVAADDDWPIATAERLDGATRKWDYCGFYRCGTGLREVLRRLAPGEVLYLKGVADPHTFESRQWIRFRLGLRRELNQFPAPFEVVSRPILARVK